MRTKYILLTILSSLVFASCNYLDFDETNNLKTKEDMPQIRKIGRAHV